jgi:integrase/recombinase XerD
MSGFEQFIQERIYLQNVSPRTVDWYRQTFKWLEKYPLTQQGLKDLIVAMRQGGLQAISCNSRIRCINAYLKWSGLPLSVPKLREESKVLPTYTEEQLKRVIEFKPKTGSERRLHTLVLVLIDSGLRVEEALLPINAAPSPERTWRCSNRAVRLHSGGPDNWPET